MSDVRTTLTALLAPERHTDLMRLVLDVVEHIPQMAGRYGEGELDQLVRAFQGVMREALAGDSREQMELLVSSAVPAFLADGQTDASLARAVTTSAVALSTALLRDVPAEQADEATAWLAEFFGEYTEAVIVEARRTEDEHGSR